MYIYIHSIIHACNGRIYDHSHSQYIYICIYINVSVAICGSSHKRKQICLVTVQVQPQRTLACPSSFRRRDDDCTLLDVPCLHIVKRRTVVFEFGSVPPPREENRMSGDPSFMRQETPESDATHRTQLAAKGKHGRVLHISWKKSRFRCNYACSGTQRLH